MMAEITITFFFSFFLFFSPPLAFWSSWNRLKKIKRKERKTAEITITFFSPLREEANIIAFHNCIIAFHLIKNSTKRCDYLWFESAYTRASHMKQFNNLGLGLVFSKVINCLRSKLLTQCAQIVICGN